MTDTLDFDYDIDDRRAYVAAATAVARLDESLLRTPTANIVFVPGSRRRGAAAIANMEGFHVRQESLCRLLGDKDLTNVDRGTRLACDVYAAMEMMSSWSGAGPDQALVTELFMKADESSGRLIRPDTQWTIEEDSTWLSEELSALAENPEPWTAVELIRKIWTSNRFLGTSRRMALLVTAWVIPRGFGCLSSLCGVADEIRKDQDGFRDVAHDKDRWSVRLAAAVAAGYSSEVKRLGDSLAGRASLLALCPPGRTTSSVEEALDYILSHPVFTAKQFSDKLGLTSRGAKVVLDKLTDTNVIEIEVSSRNNRKYICRRVI